MNYELEIQRSFPDILNTLSGSAPPLVAGSGSATLLTTATTVTWSAWTQLREDSPFTAEVWYLPVAVTGETVILGHLTDGVIFNGTDFILRIQYSDGTTLESKWTPTQVQSWHLALVYDTGHYMLYANGDLVISVDAYAGLWTTTQTVLSLNRSLAGSGSGVYDSLALYYRALSQNDIQTHYNWGKSLSTALAIDVAKGANTFTLAYPDVDILASYDFDLSAGNLINLGYGTELTAIDATGGVWQTSIPLAAIAGPTTAGILLTYEGYNTVLSYSLDGSTWAVVPNKRPILEDATSPDMVFLQLQLTDDTSWVSSFRADVIDARTIQPHTGPRVINFKGAALDQTPGIPLDYQTDQGAQIHSGYLDVLADPNTTPTNVAMVAGWMRFDANDGWVVGISGSQYVSLVAGNITSTGITMYRDGRLLASGQPALKGQWHHYVFVLSTPVNSTVRIGDKLTGGSALDVSVGSLALYPTAMTAAQIQTLYNFNTGTPTLRIDDVGTIRVSESSPAYDIYAYTWSIVGG